MSGISMLSNVDLICAYHQVATAQDGIPRTAVSTLFGLYKFLWMSFGFRNATKKFQGFIDSVTCSLPFIYAYICNLVVVSLPLGEHIQHHHVLFTRL